MSTQAGNTGHREKPAAPGRQIARRVYELAAPLCRHEGLELVHVEFQREPGGKVLRLYIDREGGVSLEDCVAVSRPLGDLLDVELDDVGPYRLEVTSPGPNRPVSKPQDFERFKGRRIRVKTTRAIDGRRSFSGVLLGLRAQQVELSVGDETIAIPLESILRANLRDQNGEV